jgi:AcrR family transcriptional regulator
MNDAGPGLREIKKQMARDSIADAALQLTLEKGLARVTIEQIAHIAFVSPRTVSNYFSCKEEAVVASGSDTWTEVIQQFELAPQDEPPLEALRRVLTGFLLSRTPEQLERNRVRLQLMEDNPSLVPFQVAIYDDLERQLRTIIAERTGTDVDGDMYPWLVASAAMSASKVAVRVWARSGAKVDDLPGLIDKAFAQIDNGLKAPADTGDTEPDCTESDGALPVDPNRHNRRHDDPRPNDPRPRGSGAGVVLRSAG